jgi:hypothetical protein
VITATSPVMSSLAGRGRSIAAATPAAAAGRTGFFMDRLFPGHGK